MIIGKFSRSLYVGSSTEYKSEPASESFESFVFFAAVPRPRRGGEGEEGERVRERVATISFSQFRL